MKNILQNSKLNPQLNEKPIIYEIIVLSHLQNRKYDRDYMYLPSPYVLEEKQKQEAKRHIKQQMKMHVKVTPLQFLDRGIENIKDEKIEKDNIKKTELFIKNSLDYYYKIEKNKIVELQKIFSQSKLGVQLKDINILSNDKIYTIDGLKNFNTYNFYNNFSSSNNFENEKQIIKIYDNHHFKLLNEIELEKGYNQIAIELDNKDLIISTYLKSFIINIYRYKNNNYILIQKIKDIQNDNVYLEYPFKKIKEIQRFSGNRFMTISDNEMKIYSLNKNNLYEVILYHSYNVDKKNNFNRYEIYINCIYKIDINNFIICTMTNSPHTNDDDVECVNNNYHYSPPKDYSYKIEKVTFDNKKSSSKVLFQKSKRLSYIYSSKYIILKKKYFMILVEDKDINLFFFSVRNGTLLKKYLFLENGENNTNLFKINKFEIYKWNCSSDDEFIINFDGNIILFKLEEEKDEIINLKIISYSYFKDVKNLKKLKDDNQFYVQFDDHILIY